MLLTWKQISDCTIPSPVSCRGLGSALYHHYRAPVSTFSAPATGSFRGHIHIHSTCLDTSRSSILSISSSFLLHVASFQLLESLFPLIFSSDRFIVSIDRFDRCHVNEKSSYVPAIDVVLLGPMPLCFSQSYSRFGTAVLDV